MIRLLAVAVLLCVATSSAACVSPSASAETSAQLTQSSPIKILSDEDFTSANGVSSGSGTSSDPYIIENLEIDGLGSLTCIWLTETTRHVVIRDVVLKNGSFGVKLQGVENVRVDSCLITNHTVGIRVSYSDKCAIVDNTISGCDYGVYVVYSEGARVEDNTFADNEVDFYEEKLPWELSRLGTYVCIALLIPLALILGLLIWMRFGPPRKGVIKPPIE